MMMVMHLVISTLMMEILLNPHSKNKRMHMCYNMHVYHCQFTIYSYYIVTSNNIPLIHYSYNTA